MATDNTALELVATPTQPPAPATLFGTNDPKEGLERMRQTAKVLANVIKQKQLFKKIGEKHHVYVEAWTFLGSMLGVFPNTVWSRPLEDGTGWEARVEARTLSGQLVGAAEASCTKDEPNWRGKPEHALRSMAQTRATSKALRMPLGFIVLLAGYNPTPAEEMPSEDLSERLEASIAAVREKKAAAVLTTPAEFAAPPLCQCKSPVGMFASESKAHYGRKYWQCQRANDRVLELKERGDLTYPQIYADKAVKDHWRSWAEPWPRKGD